MRSGWAFIAPSVTGRSGFCRRSGENSAAGWIWFCCRRSYDPALPVGGACGTLAARRLGGRMNDGRNGTVKQIICIKWGTKFGPEFVNRLYGMVARNITPPFRLYCFTDDGSGLHPDIAVRPLPEFEYQAPGTTQGKSPQSRISRHQADLTSIARALELS